MFESGLFFGSLIPYVLVPDEKKVVPDKLGVMLEEEEEALVQVVLDRTRAVRSTWGP